jgi:hypothetical protein
MTAAHANPAVSTAQLSNKLLPKARSGTAKIGDHARARALELSPHWSRARAGARVGQAHKLELLVGLAAPPTQLSNNMLPKARSGATGAHARPPARGTNSRERVTQRKEGPMKQLAFAMGQDHRREGRTA